MHKNSEGFFDPSETDLRKGVNLIEASAGTGKTYAIAMLVLRFVVERDFNIDQLLVVTFTRAATEELKTRIRARLVAAKEILENADTPDQEDLDPVLQKWLAGLDVTSTVAKQRLQLALLDIDRSGIFTIHGFCQRVLKEHALESEQLFDLQLSPDVAEISQGCADDFWRQQVYQRTQEEAAILTADIATPDALLASIQGIPYATAIYPEAENLEEVLGAFPALKDAARQQLSSSVEILQNSFAEAKFKKTYTHNFTENWQWLNLWLQGDTAIIPSLEVFSVFSREGIINGLNGIKFRSNKNQTSEQRKLEYFATLNINTGPFDRLMAARSEIKLMFRRALLESMQDHLDEHMQQHNVMSFDKLISRLAEALQGKQGELLARELQQRFQVALIDEFQDTDQSQWAIFSTLFAGNDHYLYLIGDPKQAIYQFRGADIFSYFTAQQQAQFHYTLGYNWRSHPALVSAVNQLFLRRKDPFLLQQLEYQSVSAALSAEQGALMFQEQALPPMVIWQLPEAGSKNGYWSSGVAGEAMQKAVVNEILQLLNQPYCIVSKLPGNARVEKSLQAEDMAILVRSNAQAKAFQTSLREVGVPAVLSSTESVFSTLQASDLFTVLQAVAQPGNINLLKQALTLDWFNLDGRQFYQICNNEIELDAWLNRFQDYYQQWLDKGLMAMMLCLLQREKVEPHIALSPTAARELTNLHHLLEVLQQAVVDEHLGINKTLQWLSQAITGNSFSEHLQLRLESDAKAVTIVTMHRAKGLEYSVVFCPYLWQRNQRLQSESSLIVCHEQGELVADLGSEDFARRRTQAIEEELAEDLRILYVAVTRAKYRCYLMWGDVRSEKQANQSAMAYLLFSSGNSWQEELHSLDFQQQQEQLKSICQELPEAVCYQLLDVEQNIVDAYHQNVSCPALTCREFNRFLHSPWQMSSYTALASLSQQPHAELPVDKAQERPQSILPGNNKMALPRGVHTGNVVHELLENISFSDLANGVDISGIRDMACQRYGLKLPQPELLDALLQTVVNTPLTLADQTLCLANLDAGKCLKEMPFYMTMQDMDTRQINRVLSDTPAFQPLSSRQIQGYLTGAIDLIFAYQGRYYILDYKTNDLADYQQETLVQAMREHNYGLQYWIYSLVLHQYLQRRLPGYQFAEDFGGVFYLFVRGMQTGQAGGAVFQDHPDLNRLTALADQFGVYDAE